MKEAHKKGLKRWPLISAWLKAITYVKQSFRRPINCYVSKRLARGDHVVTFFFIVRKRKLKCSTMSLTLYPTTSPFPRFWPNREPQKATTTTTKDALINYFICAFHLYLLQIYELLFILIFLYSLPFFTHPFAHWFLLLSKRVIVDSLKLSLSLNAGSISSLMASQKIMR